MPLGLRLLHARHINYLDPVGSGIFLALGIMFTIDHCSGCCPSSRALLHNHRISSSRLHLFSTSGGTLSSPHALPSVIKRFDLLCSSFVNGSLLMFISSITWSIFSSGPPISGEGGLQSRPRTCLNEFALL